MKSFPARFSVFLTLLFLSAYYVGAHDVNLLFYMHDAVGSSKPTAIPVAAPHGNFSVIGFGRTLVIDDALTEGPDPNSPAVGRAQGIYSFASLTAEDFFMAFTAVLHTPEYNGSTICLGGANRTGLFRREIAVVGGTGQFRFARGFADIQTISNVDLVGVLRIHVTIRL